MNDEHAKPGDMEARKRKRKLQITKAQDNDELKELGIEPRYVPVILPLVRGRRLRAIADVTGLTLSTVRSYARDLYRITGSHGRWEFMNWVRQHREVFQK